MTNHSDDLIHFRGDEYAGSLLAEGFKIVDLSQVHGTDVLFDGQELATMLYDVEPSHSIDQLRRIGLLRKRCFQATARDAGAVG